MMLLHMQLPECGNWSLYCKESSTLKWFATTDTTRLEIFSKNINMY